VTALRVTDAATMSPDIEAKERPADPALDAAWQAFCRWDAASVARRFRLKTSRGIIFVLMIGAAVSGVLASELKTFPWIAGIAAACSAAAALIAREAVGPAIERLWLVARAAAETLKSEAFKYAAGVEPYSSSDRQERLISAVSAIEADNIAGPSPSPPHAPRSLPQGALDQAGYLRTRLEDQIGWYEQRAHAHSRLSSMWRWASVALGLSGAVLGSVAASSAQRTFLGAWVGVIGTLGGIFAAHIAGSRLSYLAQTYELTARRLRHLNTEWGLVPRDQRQDKWNAFVLQCEATISAEREQWVKEWQRQVAAAQTPASTHAETTASSSF
jgi:SMODS and SLOG-associating 2TM effector domain 1/Protein of unknown function (DUF4231)